MLALDTATSAVTVAVHDGSQVVGQDALTDPRRHAETLTPMIAAVTSAAGNRARDLTAIAAGVGPGPFTGLRVGLATAVTLGLALDIPVHGVCSLDALAYAAAGEPGAPARFVVATDARRSEVYWACYDVEQGVLTRTSGMPQVGRAADLPEQVRALPATGRGPVLYPDAFAVAFGPLDVPAGAVAGYAVQELTAGRTLLPPQPLYLRAPDATPAAAQKSVLR